MTTHDAPHTDLLAALDRALASTDRLIAGIDAGQWSTPTPCTEWDVRALVTHVTSGMLNFAALVRGDPRPDGTADDQADDPVAAYRSAAATMRAAFGAPGALDRIYPSPIGRRRGPCSCICGSLSCWSTAGTWPARPASRPRCPPTLPKGS